MDSESNKLNFKQNGFVFGFIDKIFDLSNVVSPTSVTKQDLIALSRQTAAYNKEEPEAPPSLITVMNDPSPPVVPKTIALLRFKIISNEKPQLFGQVVDCMVHLAQKRPLEFQQVCFFVQI